MYVAGAGFGARAVRYSRRKPAGRVCCVWRVADVTDSMVAVLMPTGWSIARRERGWFRLGGSWDRRNPFPLVFFPCMRGGLRGANRSKKTGFNVSLEAAPTIVPLLAC